MVTRLEFCPKCGKKLAAEKEGGRGKGGVVWVCSKCGFRKKVEGGGRAVVPFAAKESEPVQESVAVIGREEQKLRTMPSVRVECPKCGNNLAFVWQVQTRGSDESSTQFFRCTRCGFTFREYT